MNKVDPFRLINSEHLRMIAPLAKWKVLSLKDLKKECGHLYHYSGFQRLMRTLERKGILKGYRDPWNRKKYYYLSELGNKLFYPKNQSSEYSDEFISHDSRVSDISRELLDWGIISKVDIESKGSFVPDAEFSGGKKSQSYVMAFELEISRKSKERIRNKLIHYGKSSIFDFILYIFATEGLRDLFKEILEEIFPRQYGERFLLFYLPTLFSKKMMLKKAEGYFKNKKMFLENIT